MTLKSTKEIISVLDIYADFQKIGKLDLLEKALGDYFNEFETLRNKMQEDYTKLNEKSAIYAQEPKNKNRIKMVSAKMGFFRSLETYLKSQVNVIEQNPYIKGFKERIKGLEETIEDLSTKIINIIIEEFGS